MNELEVRLKSLGDIVKAIRKEKGLSQVELGIAANTSQMTIQRLEKGAGGTGIDNLMGIAEALQLTLSELFELVDGKTERKVHLVTPWDEIQSKVNELPAAERDWVASMVGELIKNPWKAS